MIRSNVIDDLQDHQAKAAQALGPLTVEWSDAMEQPGGAPRSARFQIVTTTPRPADIGGGVVTFYGYIDVGGNSHHIDSLNAIGRHVAAAFSDTSRLLALVSNAFDASKRARLKAADAESRLARALHGGRARGDLHVAMCDSGEVWLQDPEKRDRGFGFKFSSLDELWRSHPDLRPVAWGADDRGPFMTVRAFAMEGGQ